MEDFTGMGFADLSACMIDLFLVEFEHYDEVFSGVIRTPISPYITFKDDPLRVSTHTYFHVILLCLFAC